MKKIILLLLISISFTGICQNAYYDALVLKSRISSEEKGDHAVLKYTLHDKDSTLSILTKYLSVKKQDEIKGRVNSLNQLLEKKKKEETELKKQNKTEDQIKEALQDLTDEIDNLSKEILAEIENEFRKNPYIQLTGTIKSNQVPNLPQSLAGSISSLGGINVATFANELSKFMIDRAKQELNVAFFNRLKAFFEKTPEVTVLFPKTTDALENLLSYQYPTMISTLRNAFHEDLQEVFFRTDDVFKLPKYRELVKEFPEIILSLKTIQLIAEIDNEAHPSDILGDFKDIPEWKEYEDNLSDALYNFYNAFKAGHMFSESLRFDPSKQDTVLKYDAKTSEYYIQKDTGIAIAIKKNSVYYKVDTIRRGNIDDLRRAISTIIRNNFDKSQISDLNYTNAFLRNLFGDDHIPVLTLPTAANNIEALINTISTTVKSQSSKFEITESNFIVQKMIRTYDSTRAWVTRQHLNYLIQDSTTFKIYLGLLYQQSSIDAIQFVKKPIEITADREFTSEYVLRKGSIIKKGSTVNRENDNPYQNDETLTSDMKVTKGILTINSRVIEYKPLTDILDTHKRDLFIIRDYLVEIIEQAEEVDDHYSSIKKKRKEDQEITQQEIYEYVNTGINVIETTIDVSKFFSDEELDYDNYLKIARNGNDMYLHIVQKEYASAVNNLVSIYELIMEEAKKNKDGILETATKSADELKTASSRKTEKITSNKEAKFESDQAKSIKGFDGLISSTTKIIKYGTFMANLVQSDSAEEISAVIQSAALPVGSYSIKRASRYNVSLNAYLGASYSGGIFDEVPDKIETNPIGIWAPVGIAGSIGLGKSDKGGSVSIFLSIIDVGAFVNYNLTKSSIDTLAIMDASDPNNGGSRIIGYEPEEFPDIKLEDIFSPGIHLIYGIPRWPLSIGIGRQRRPELHQIEVIETILDANGVVVQEPTFVQTIQANTWSWQVTLTVDLPLINLYSRPK